MTIYQVIISSIAGLISGAIATLVAPWVKWGIEKRKFRYHNREKLISELRRFASENEFDRVKFVNSTEYLTIRKELSKKTIENFEYSLNEIHVNLDDPAVEPEKVQLMDDINEIAKRWGIV